MTLLQVIILAVVQGITEFLPISSSGHLVAIPMLLEWDQQSSAFDVFLHFGSFFSLVIYFRKIIVKLLQGILKKNKESIDLTIKIIITTIPALIIGAVFSDTIDNLSSSPILLILNLMIIGAIFIILDARKTEGTTTSLDKLDKKSAFLIGLFQVLAYIRGTSRSGITIIGGLSQGLNRKKAAEYSFLVGMPIILAATVFKIPTFLSEFSNDSSLLLNYLIGFLTTFIVGLISIHFLMKIIDKKGLTIFGIYRIILGIFLIIFLF